MYSEADLSILGGGGGERQGTRKISVSSSNGVRALIFDFDGTLVDTMPAHYRAWQATLSRHGMALSEARFYELAGWSTRRLAEMLIREFDSDMTSAALAQEKEAEFQRSCAEIAPIMPVIEIAARHRGTIPMGVATSGMRSVVTPILRKYRLLDWFDCLVTADDVPNAKPAPELFLEAARRLEVEPAGCLVYEDAEAGFEAARRAGMRFVDMRPLIQDQRATEAENG